MIPIPKGCLGLDLYKILVEHGGKDQFIIYNL